MHDVAGRGESGVFSMLHGITEDALPCGMRDQQPGNLTRQGSDQLTFFF